MGEQNEGNFLTRWLRRQLAAEALVRNTLLLGFLVMVLLVVVLGYWSRQSLLMLEAEVSRLKEIESGHLRLVMSLDQGATRMFAEARGVLANPPGSTLRWVAENRLDAARRDLQRTLDAGRLSDLSETSEWARVEAEFVSYWEAIHQPNPTEWGVEREELMEALNQLEAYVDRERAENDRQAEALNRRARQRLGRVTLAVVGMSFVVAGLAFFETRRMLRRLSQAYAASAESRDYLRSLLDSLVSGVLVIDREGRIETVSESFIHALGLQSPALLGSDYRELFADRPQLCTAIRRRLKTESYNHRYLGRVELGEEQVFDVFGSRLVIRGEGRGLILVFVDMTDMERVQSELRRNRALSAIGQMTAQIAHEIKNPLGSIRFATTLLKRAGSANGHENSETIEAIERSVDHLASIVSELSEFARPKELNYTEINLNQLLEGLMPMVADRLNAKGLRIETRLASDLPSGQFDATELRKLFLNLMINAIDASEAGGIVELRSAVQDGRVVVEVVDQGCGMDSDTLRRIFEPFYTTKKSGTGLGMAISKKITELHQGDLIIASRPGAGTTVKVRLPLSPEGADNSRPSESVTASEVQ